jgi:hypothetical protein
VTAFEPQDYPGVAVDAAALLTDGDPPVRAMRAGRQGFEVEDPSGWLDLDEVLAQAGAAPLRTRTPVVAVGSNGSPTVMLAKLGSPGASRWLPMARCVVTGVAIGHSAHVSVRGYVAAAPYASPGVQTPMVLSWLDESQLTALDATEPNYRRVGLNVGRFPLQLPAPVVVERCDIYESLHGVIAVDGRPVPMSAQAALHATLARMAGIAELASWSDTAAAVAALTQLDLQVRIRRTLADRGYAVPSGL